MKELECSQDFSHYKSMGIFPDAQGRLTPKHGKLILTGIYIRFDNVIVFIDLSNCLPLIDAAIIGKVN